MVSRNYKNTCLLGIADRLHDSLDATGKDIEYPEGLIGPPLFSLSWKHKDIPDWCWLYKAPIQLLIEGIRMVDTLQLQGWLQLWVVGRVP